MNLPVKIDIFGSCVSREPLNYISSKYGIIANEYIHKQSIWFSEPLPREEDWPIITEDEVLLDHQFERRSVCTILNGTSRDRLEKNRGDWVLIDDHYFIPPIFRITNNESGANRLIQCAFEVHSEITRIVNNNPKYKHYSIEKLDATPNYPKLIKKISEWLQKTYGNNIIIIDAESASYDYSDAGTITKLNVDSVSDIHRIYATKMLIDNLDCLYIPIHSELLSRDGVSVHYNFEVYEYIGNLIGESIINKKRVFHDYTYNYQRKLIDFRLRNILYLSTKSCNLNQLINEIAVYKKNPDSASIERAVRLCLDNINLSSNGLVEKELGLLYSINNTSITNYNQSKKWLHKALKDGCNCFDSYYLVLSKIGSEDSFNELMEECSYYSKMNERVSCGWLGRIYRDGKGVDKNLDIAGEWMKKAADLNLKWAKWEYFEILWEINTPESLKNMIEYGKAESEKGNMELRARLARAYRDGRGVPKNLKKAASLMKSTLKSNPQWAKWEYADILWKMNSLDSDKEMFNFALPYANNGQRDFQGLIGRAYRDGRGVEKDLMKAIEWMKKAADQNLAWAKWEYYNILWIINTPDSLKIMIEYGKAESEKGNMELRARLARAYRDGRGVEKDLMKAANLLKSVLPGNPIWARWEYLDILWNINTPETDKEAFEYCDKMLKTGGKEIEARMARMYRDGRGVKKNMNNAISLMKSAADKGQVWASNELLQMLWYQYDTKNNNETDTDSKQYKAYWPFHKKRSI